MKQMIKAEEILRVMKMASIDEINYEWFKRNLPDLMKEHRGNFHERI